MIDSPKNRGTPQNHRFSTLAAHHDLAAKGVQRAHLSPTPRVQQEHGAPAVKPSAPNAPPAAKAGLTQAEMSRLNDALNDVWGGALAARGLPDNALLTALGRYACRHADAAMLRGLLHTLCHASQPSNGSRIRTGRMGAMEAITDGFWRLPAAEQIPLWEKVLDLLNDFDPNDLSEILAFANPCAAMGRIANVKNPLERERLLTRAEGIIHRAMADQPAPTSSNVALNNIWMRRRHLALETGELVRLCGHVRGVPHENDQAKAPWVLSAWTRLESIVEGKKLRQQVAAGLHEPEDESESDRKQRLKNALEAAAVMGNRAHFDAVMGRAASLPDIDEARGQALVSGARLSMRMGHPSTLAYYEQAIEALTRMPEGFSRSMARAQLMRCLPASPEMFAPLVPKLWALATTPVAPHDLIDDLEPSTDCAAVLAALVERDIFDRDILAALPRSMGSDAQLIAKRFAEKN